MEIDFKTCTAEELWKYVASFLEQKGFDVVLVGGAVVSIYSKGMYKSGDLDFIVRSFNKKGLPRALEEIGFTKSPERYFKHPDCKHLFLEFPTGPIEIAENYDIEPDEVSVGKTKIKILSPTDCVLDRLEQFFVGEYGKPHGERKLFEQGLLVAQNRPVNLEKIKSFCEKQKALSVFTEFVSHLRT
jgi:hypothetical protein